MKSLLAVMLVAVVASPLAARTWTVERDGSGDFAVIQNAVDAAASGDTILIGPGRFDEGRIETTPGWTEFVRILIDVEELTLIGAGPDLTIVGQEEPWNLSQGGHRGIQTGSYWGSNRITVEGIRFENMTFGINDEDVDALNIKSCAFSGNLYSVISDSRILKIIRCNLDEIRRDGAHLITWGQDYLLLDECRFSTVPDEHWNQTHVAIHQAENAVVRLCSFVGGATGFQAGTSSNAVVESCTLRGQSDSGIIAGNGCAITARDCSLSDQNAAFVLGAPNATLEVSGAVITDVSMSSLTIKYPGSGFFRDCVLARGDEYVVNNIVVAPVKSEPGHFNMRNNWWGTAEPDSIQAWILDANDDPEIGYVVDWEPFHGQTVSTESESLGTVKSMFRRSTGSAGN